MVSSVEVTLGVVLVALVYFVFVRKPRWKNAPPGMQINIQISLPVAAEVVVIFTLWDRGR